MIRGEQVPIKRSFHTFTFRTDLGEKPSQVAFTTHWSQQSPQLQRVDCNLTHYTEPKLQEQANYTCHYEHTTSTAVQRGKIHPSPEASVGGRYTGLPGAGPQACAQKS